MDKQKDFEKGWEDYKTKRKQQTEEIIGIIQKSVGGCARNWASLIAEELIKYYQPKIPTNAVVLTKAHEDKIFNDYVEYIKKVRKETAKKFAERLKERFNPYYTEGLSEAIDKIAKEITEGEV